MDCIPPVREVLSRLKQAIADGEANWRLRAKLTLDLSARWGEMVDGNGRPIEYWAAYLAKALGKSRRHIHRLRDAGRVLQLIEGVTPGSHPIDPASLCEKVLRPLTRLLPGDGEPADDLLAAWRRALELPSAEDPNSRQVRVLARHTARAVRPYLLPDRDTAAVEDRRLRRIKRDLRKLSQRQQRQLLEELAAQLGLVVEPGNSSGAPRSKEHDDGAARRSPAGSSSLKGALLDDDEALRTELPDGADCDRITRFLHERLRIDRGRASKQARHRLMTPDLARSVASRGQGRTIDNPGGYFGDLIDNALAETEEQHRRRLADQAEAERHAVEEADRAIDDLPDDELRAIANNHPVLRGVEDLDSIRTDRAFRPELANLLHRRLQEATT